MFKYLLTCLFVHVVFLLPFAVSGFADDVCFQCHDRNAFTGTVIHPPVDQKLCSRCHNPHVARHKGLLNSREDKLCYSCHVNQQSEFNRGVVHDPVAKGDCSACHSPHVSEQKGLLLDNLATECFNCHTKLNKEYPQTHQPYAQGDCTVCHKPHQADNGHLLSQSPDKLCFSCHDTDVLEKGHPNYPGTLQGCLSCHNPHGSDRQYLVRNNLHKPYADGCTGCHDDSEGVTMIACLDCHDEIQEQVEATHSHLTLHNGNSCLNCHSPHAGDTQSLLKSRERLICTPCHDATLHGYKENAFKHPDINSCSSCHESHGSRHLSMLRGNGNDVCVECHKTQGKFTHPVGPGVLNSLTGQTITCVTCHNPMGTDYQHHLVQDGNKALCIQCHRSY